MKRFLSIFLTAMLLFGATAALATNAETGEQYSSGTAGVNNYDRQVIQFVQPNQVFLGVRAADAEAPSVALKKVTSELLNMVSSGQVTAVNFPGVDKVFGADVASEIASLPTPEAKVEAFVAALNDLDTFDPASGSFAEGVEAQHLSEEDFLKGSLESGMGFLTLGGVEVPFIRLAIETTQADGQTVVNNFNFTYATHNNESEPSWGLYSIIAVDKDLFS